MFGILSRRSRLVLTHGFATVTVGIGQCSDRVGSVSGKKELRDLSEAKPRLRIFCWFEHPDDVVPVVRPNLRNLRGV